MAGQDIRRKMQNTKIFITLQEPFIVKQLNFRKFQLSMSFTSCEFTWHKQYLFLNLQQILEADVAQLVGARPSEREGGPFDLRHSIDVRFDFPLFHIAVPLNTRKTEH